jgi:transposase-like protein
VSLLVAIGVNSEGYREILGICEGAKEDKAGWSAFLKHLKERGSKACQDEVKIPYRPVTPANDVEAISLA